MRSNRTTIARLCAGVAPLAVLFATPAMAQTAPAAQAPAAPAAEETPPDVVVTGSLFRRTDTETPSPVSVLSSAALQQRGLTTISDAIQTISAGNGGAVPQNFTGAFASGASGVSLRGLTTNSTLTLFDGLRAANYPLADDGQRSFVDLNTIPSAIVDRVEVLRDGASSTYGADAIAGVVNIILKKQITGLIGRVEAGVSQRGDSDNQRLQLTAGFGDLADKGFNFYISGEYQHLGQVFNRERGFPFNTNNLTSISAGNGFTGRNANFGATPPSATSSSGSTSAVALPAVLTTPGNILSGVAIGSGPGANLFSVINGGGCGVGTTQHNNTRGSYCEQDLINQYGVIQPEQTRFGGTFHATVNVGSDAQAYFVGTFYQSKVLINGTPQSIRSNGNPAETRGIVLPAVLANGSINPQDPFANIIDPATGQRESALIYYRFGDIPSSLTNLSRTYRVAAGIDGKFGGDWGYSAAATYMRTDLEQTRRGFLYLPGLITAINTGTYNFVNPSLNSQAVRDSIAPTLNTRANSELWQVQGTITKDLFALAGGALQLGVGGQVRYESVYDPSPVPNKDFITVNPFQAVGNRYVEAAFFEINAPILTNLEVNGSGRYDHYSTGFSHFSPKIGAKFTPIREIAIRGTFSTGFRAPSIPEVSGSVIGFTNYTPGDSLSAADKATLQALYGNNSYITTQYGLGNNSTGNPNIKPETSRAFTGGVVFQPRRWLSLTVDYYNIRKKNLILSAGGNPAAIADKYLLTGIVDPGATITPNPVDPAHAGLRATPLSVNFLYSNGNTLQTSGLDVEIQATIPLSSNVKFTTMFEGTEIFNYNIDDGTGKGIQRFVGTLASYAVTSASGTPRFRATWQNTIEAGPFSLTGTAYYVSGYKGYADDNSGPGSTCANATETSVQYTNDGVNSKTGPALQCDVHHWIDIDLTGQVKVSNKFTFYVNVINLFDAKAPFDPNTYGGNNYNPAWSSAGVIGRMFRAGATFKF
ncbi:MAG: TonB-dependent receptor [Sphingomonas bacterium]|uniref:TonB-dependent receptor domain-containing protein n=1 Tax=Sphingomonas bacterium TaxID=1895847 RepID=UPI0026136BE4|nr:TonB-dependent receptor [Sphingomonas bacterium]MDB5712071.1 TonB-dependent receptor [Sphingomonas bacterium]